MYIYILHFIYLLERYYGKPNNKPSPDFPEMGAYEPSKVGDTTLTNSDGLLTEPPPDQRKLLKTVVNETKWKENRIKWKLIDIQKTTSIYLLGLQMKIRT